MAPWTNSWKLVSFIIFITSPIITFPRTLFEFLSKLISHLLELSIAFRQSSTLIDVGICQRQRRNIIPPPNEPRQASSHWPPGVLTSTRVPTQSYRHRIIQSQYTLLMAHGLENSVIHVRTSNAFAPGTSALGMFSSFLHLHPWFFSTRGHIPFPTYLHPWFFSTCLS